MAYYQKITFRKIKKSEQSIITTHKKKLQNLRKNRSNPFTHEEVAKNLCTKNVPLEELNILKFGLNHSLPTLKLRKTDVFVYFQMIHRFLREDLKNDADEATLTALTPGELIHTQLPTIKTNSYRTSHFKETSQ